MTTSKFVVIPERFCGLRVLLIEADKRSLEHHAFILSRNCYRVTAIPEVATGLSKILNGESYDCVLIDADIREADMMDFLHQSFKHQPQSSIIMMASNNIGMRLFKETLQNEAILCLPKPCDPRDICNILQNVFRKKVSIERGDYLNGESPKENQEHNIFKRIEHPMVKNSRTLNPTLMNGSFSSGSGTYEGLNIHSQEYGVMFKPVKFEKLRSNDDDQEHVSSNYTVTNVDKGKQPREDDRYCKKRRITWTRDLHRKFVEAINKLGKQKAYPTNILKVMKVPGLTRSQVASHLQKYQENQKIIKNPTLVPQMQNGNSLQVKSYTHRISRKSTLSDNHPSILPFLSNVIQRPMKLNSIGIAYMTINNIKARLQRARPLPITTNNSSDSDQSTDNNFRHLFQPSMAETRMITASVLAENCNSSTTQRNEVQSTGNNGYGSSTGSVDAASFSNSFVSENYEGVGASLTPLDSSRIAIKTSWIAGKEPPVGEENYNHEMYEISNPFGMTNSSGGGGGTSEYSSNYKDLHSQNFQRSGANLFPNFLHAWNLDDVEDFINPNFSNSDLATFEVESVDYSHFCFPVEENNRQAQTLPPLNYHLSVDGFEQSDSFSNGSQWNLEMTMNLLEELDDHLINGPW